MGQTLREIYVGKFGFLDQSFDPKALFIRSTDVWRTIQSAEANLLGLYPPDSRPPGTIIDINVDPASVTDGYPNTDPCPRLAQLQKKIQTSAAWVQREAALSNVIKKIRYATRTTGVSYFDQVDRLADNLHCRVCTKLSLPCQADVCVSQDDTTQLFKLTDWQSFAITNGTEVSKLNAGLLIQDAITLFQNVIDNKSSKKDPLFKLNGVAETSSRPEICDVFWT
eukprot:TRINITY_DN976_c0_g1_i2.p1 TRINITY_DN976_c0_g1~~TRINITY_DN976_c0_g1_i2.p1  ORF type:complete len:224 (+),score=46.55 TRINITY_DN976_c0_g1_i2:566-1237(+)